VSLDGDLDAAGVRLELEQRHPGVVQDPAVDLVADPVAERGAADAQAAAIVPAADNPRVGVDEAVATGRAALRAGRWADAGAAFEAALAEQETPEALDGLDHARALGHFEAALAAFVAAGLPHEEARARLALSRLLSTSKPEVAIAEARTALAIADQLGAVAEADAAASLLRSLGVRGRTGPKDVGVLSKREQEVLRLVGIGLSNPRSPRACSSAARPPHTT
jgi:ATP/maltotriose-dependent transcriptional regulator MalT